MSNSSRKTVSISAYPLRLALADRANGARVPIPVAADAVRYPLGEPTFAQPPDKGQMRRQRLLVAVATEKQIIQVGGCSRPEARLRRLGRALR